jgi:hypothetical protein
MRLEDKFLLLDAGHWTLHAASTDAVVASSIAAISNTGIKFLSGDNYPGLGATA